MYGDDFKKIIGKTVSAIREDGDIYIDFNDGIKCSFYHSQDCCESVSLHSTRGLSKLVGKVITDVIEEVGDEVAPDVWKPEGEDSWTWTKITFKAGKVKCWALWYGTSNGYYSEGVDFTMS